jgi:hypothetical protein
MPGALDVGASRALRSLCEKYVELQGTGTRGIYKIVDLSDMYNTD